MNRSTPAPFSPRAAAPTRRLTGVATARRLAAALLLAGVLAAGAGRAGASLEEARAALAAGDFRRALKEAAPSIAEDPIAAHVLRAEAYRGLREPAQAVGEVQRALSFAPEDRAVILQLAALLVEAGRPEQAADYYEVALRMRPADWPTLVAYRDLLVHLRRHQRIVEIAAATAPLLADRDQFRTLHRHAAAAHESLGDAGAAATALAVALDGAGAPPDDFLALGKLYFAARQWDRAAIAMREVLQSGPNDEATFVLAEALWALGRKTDATEHYATLIEKKSPLDPRIEWEKRQRTLERTTPAARFLHRDFGLMPFIAGVLGLLLVILVAAVVMLRRLKD